MTPRGSVNSTTTVDTEEQALEGGHAIPPTNKSKAGRRSSVKIGVKKALAVEASVRRLTETLEASDRPKAMLPPGGSRV